MLESNLGTLEDLFEGKLIPWVAWWCVGFGTIDDSPIVVVISVRVEGDLLFYLSAQGSHHKVRYRKLTFRSSRVGVSVRMKVSTLCGYMSNGHDGPESDVYCSASACRRCERITELTGIGIIHPMSTEGMLEL